MNIHYVEDANSDILALKHSLKSRSDIHVNACARMDQLPKAGTGQPIDVLLVDVMRPDAVSIENDVLVARKVTDAPILFLTGLSPEDILDRAITAGADGVISKAATSADLICQFVQNARVRARLRPAPPVEDRAPPARRVAPADWLTSSPTLAAADGPLAYVETGLQALLPWTTKRTALWSRAMTVRMLKTVRRLRRLGERDFGTTSECDATRIVGDVLAELVPDLAEAGVALSADLHEEIFFTALGTEEDAEEGFDAIINGLVARCSSGDWVRVSLTLEVDQATLTIAANRPLVSGAEEFFATRMPPSAPLDGAVAELQCGAALLALREQQIRLSPDGEEFRVTILL